MASDCFFLASAIAATACADGLAYKKGFAVASARMCSSCTDDSHTAGL